MSTSPAQPRRMPITWHPSRSARIVTARIAGFSPGTSPPPVRIPITPFFAFTLILMPTRFLRRCSTLIVTDFNHSLQSRGIIFDRGPLPETGATATAHPLKFRPKPERQRPHIPCHSGRSRSDSDPTSPVIPTEAGATATEKWRNLLLLLPPPKSRERAAAP